MTFNDLLNTHPLLSDRIRLSLMVAIATNKDTIDFNTLLSELNLSRGNLSSHLRKLEEAGLIQIEKKFVERRPRTTYICTVEGQSALNSYLKEIEKLLQYSMQK